MIDTCKYKKLAKNRSPNFQHKMENWHQQIHLPKTSRNPVPVSSSTRKFCGVNPFHTTLGKGISDLDIPIWLCLTILRRKKKHSIHWLETPYFPDQNWPSRIENWEICIYIYIYLFIYVYVYVYVYVCIYIYVYIYICIYI